MKSTMMSKVKGFVSKVLALMLAAGLCVGVVPETTFAASTDSISVTGTYNYTMANSVLSEVNSQRSKAGVSKLTLDKTLTSEAMKRAAEISIYYSHTRPNGSGYASAYSKLGNYSGENIAAGQSSASAVMKSWMNSSGHKANILSKNYKSIGIGSFTNNGVTYWVQVFSSSSGSSQSKSGSSNTTVSVSAKSSYISGCLTLTPASSSINKGKTTGITAYIKNKGASGFKAKINNSCLKWSSGSSSVASVSSSGTVTGKAAGSAKITAKTSNGGASASTTITVKNTTKSISSCSISLSKTSYTYDGTAKKPTVTVKNGSTTLKNGTDYSVSYKNNTNKGTASVVITGKGNYTGSVTKNFTIGAFNLSGCSIKLSSTSYTYDGTAKKPTATVKRGSTTLKSGTDYTISYKNNTKAGTASAVITGKGNYTGSVTKTFTIKEKTSSSTTTGSTTKATTNTSSKPATTSITSLKSSASGQMTVKWNKVSGVGGYVLYYSQSPNFYASKSYDTKGYEIWPSDSYTSHTFTSMEKGKTYYVRMRTYQKINGVKTYSDWSSVKTVTIAK